MVDRKDTMLRAAYTAEAAKHSKSVIFWLGGGWKFLAGLLLAVVVVGTVVKGGGWAAGHLGQLVAPAFVVLVVVGVVLGLVVVSRGGGRGRRF